MNTIVERYNKKDAIPTDTITERNTHGIFIMLRATISREGKIGILMVQQLKHSAQTPKR